MFAEVGHTYNKETFGYLITGKLIKYFEQKTADTSRHLCESFAKIKADVLTAVIPLAFNPWFLFSLLGIPGHG